MLLSRRELLCLWILGDPVTWGVRAVVLTSLPMIWGIFQHLGVELPLGIVGLVLFINF